RSARHTGPPRSPSSGATRQEAIRPSVKPSAKPTQVRTLDLPPPAAMPLSWPDSVRGRSCHVRLHAARGACMRVAVPNTCPSFARCRSSSSGCPWHVLTLAGHGGFLDPALGFVLLPRDALGVDAQQDVDAVSCPLGDLRGGHTSVQPGGNGRVPQVVGAPGEQGRPFLAGERRGAGLMEDLEVGPVLEDAAPGTGEDAPVRAGRILLQVLAEERDQVRMEGHRAGLTARTVLELAALASRATVGPPGAWHGLPRPADGGQAGDPARP